MKKLVVSALLSLSLLLSFASCDFVLVEELPLDGNYEVSAEDGYVVVNGVKTEYKVPPARSIQPLHPKEQ